MLAKYQILRLKLRLRGYLRAAYHFLEGLLMGKKYFIRSTEKIEDKIKALQAEVARLSVAPKVAVYSPPEVHQVTAINTAEEKLDLPPLEEEAVFIPSQMAQGSADLKTVQKKTVRFDVKDLENLKTKSGKVK